MTEHWHEIRVRYAETDQMGVVHHSRYALYLEEARTQAMREMGIPYNELEAKGIALPLVSMEFKFMKAAKYDDIVRIRTIVNKMPAVKFEIDYEIYVGDVLITTANTILVFTNKETFRPTRCPDDILEKFKMKMY